LTAPSSSKEVAGTPSLGSAPEAPLDWEAVVLTGDSKASLGHFIEVVDRGTSKIHEATPDPAELLVHSHRLDHPVDIHARYMMSRVIRKTGNEDRAVRSMRRMRHLGWTLSSAAARLLRFREPERVGRALFGLQRSEVFFRFKRQELPNREIRRLGAELRQQAAVKLAPDPTGAPRPLRVLLTGGTGFIGKEILHRCIQDPTVAEIWLVIRPREVRDRSTGRLLETVSPEQRGETLLDQLWIRDPKQRQRVRFLAGDVEQPLFGLPREQVPELARHLTHVVHCAASVAFDAPFDQSFRANVLGTLQALRFSRALQSAPGSSFISHIGVETSYIHGRTFGHKAREGDLRVPEHHYNNYYELTKAIASLASERFMAEQGLRMCQLCPSIVIGDARTGNNRGDTKVVHAPVNLFGTVAEAPPAKSWRERSRAAFMTRVACAFPGDPTAEINLITVDRVAEGILTALRRPTAVGRRIHLANDRRLSAARLQEVLHEELGVEVNLVDPTLHRTIGLPLLRRLLIRLGQSGPARMVDRMNAVFAGYVEWGQPVHEVGRDVRLLGLSPRRPDPAPAFRMLCRHNRFVQRFGRIRDLDVLSRREELWRSFIDELEQRLGRAASDLSPAEFEAEVRRAELEFFEDGQTEPSSSASHTSG